MAIFLREEYLGKSNKCKAKGKYKQGSANSGKPKQTSKGKKK